MEGIFIVCNCAKRVLEKQNLLSEKLPVMLCNGEQTHFCGLRMHFISYFYMVIIHLYVVLPMLEEIYAILGMMFSLYVIHG